MQKIIKILVLVFVILVLWQVIEGMVDRHRVINNETSIEVFIASPHSIIKTFTQSGGLILNELSYTLARAGEGLLLGVVLAFGMSLLFIIFPSTKHPLLSISFAFNSFPIVGFAPIIILAFGQGSWLSIVFVSMLISYFPILISLNNTFQNIEKDIMDVMKVFNASKKQLILKVYLPSSIPGLLTSLRLAIPASIIGATIGEWLGTRNGIGQLITISLYQLKPGLLYASLLAVTLSGVILVGILVFAEKRLLVWRR